MGNYFKFITLKDFLLPFIFCFILLFFLYYFTLFFVVVVAVFLTIYLFLLLYFAILFVGIKHLFLLAVVVGQLYLLDINTKEKVLYFWLYFFYFLIKRKFKATIIVIFISKNINDKRL